jgi:hypothetical protein
MLLVIDLMISQGHRLIKEGHRPLPGGQKWRTWVGHKGLRKFCENF